MAGNFSTPGRFWVGLTGYLGSFGRRFCENSGRVQKQRCEGVRGRGVYQTSKLDKVEFGKAQSKTAQDHTEAGQFINWLFLMTSTLINCATLFLNHAANARVHRLRRPRCTIDLRRFSSLQPRSRFANSISPSQEGFSPVAASRAPPLPTALQTRTGSKTGPRGWQQAALYIKHQNLIKLNSARRNPIQHRIIRKQGSLSTGFF